MLFAVYAGKDKKLLKCEGNHNTRRPSKIIRTIGEFLYDILVNKNIKINNNNNNEEVNNIFNLNFNSEESINKEEMEIKKNNLNHNKENIINDNEKNKNEIQKNEIKEESKNNNQDKEKKMNDKDNV